MPKISNAAHLRRTVAGISLVLAPVLFAAAEVVWPTTSGDAGKQLATYAEHRGALLAGVLFSITSAMFFVPAIFGLLQRIRARGSAFGHISAILMVYGLIATTALDGVNIMFWEMAKPSYDRATMTALLNGLQHEPVGAVLLLGHYLFAIGMILLGVAAWRARISPHWAAMLVIVAPILDILIGFTPLDGVAGDVVSGAVCVIGFAALGVKLLGSPDGWDEVGDVPQVIAAQPVSV